MKFLLYSLQEAFECNIKKHPQEYMNEHFSVIHCVPRSLSDGWWFCVEDFDVELPPFLSKMEPYNLNYWKDKCWNNCKYFEKSFNCSTQIMNGRYSCYGGWNCLKEKYGAIENFENINNIN